MERSKALEIVKPHLTAHRYEHTLGVIETAVELAERVGVNKQKAELAAVFHDYAKFRDKNEMRQLVKESLPDKLILEYGSELLHAPCGAYYVEHEVGITDKETLDAIKYHTTGRPGMTLLDKVLYLADYIEPGRDFPGVAEVRELAKTSIDEAIIQALNNTMIFLLKRRQQIFPETLATYNDLIKDRKKEK
ncbi:bis(5'-nucleosyl)-tetraphosphatase (symmetrical) YqeK [Bacillus solitudinis]|uniref:bis(5'-nucleosyl)-tetraphosphatase (symmetrical) YqeK n=1 Tax=Bacillus solitudinis TaxID=2014074 RepID=UPI000C2325C2|nr:bis(5'-nucleosyl)-tetraphosphatase (symmetrical) YqeK [Bacillus solitudinis]